MKKGFCSTLANFFVVPIFLTLFLAITTKAFAISPSLTPGENTSPTIVQSQPASPMQYKLNTNPDVPQNMHTYTQSVFIELLSTATCFLVGFDPIETHSQCLGIDSATGKIGYAPSSGGLMAITGNMIGGTFNIPVSSVQYGHYLASNFGITRTSYAQFDTGPGFNGLTPLLKIWTLFRNMSYTLFVLVFVILGLGIMFRVNIDARTVMTIQNQIPKIIVALILITFSYAIAGFLIDMMYLAMYLIIHMFNSNNLAVVTSVDVNPINAVGGIGGIGGIANPAAQSVGNAVSGIFDGNLGGGLGGTVTRILGAIAGGTAGAATGKLIGGVVGLGLGLAAVAATIASGGLALPIIVAGLATAGAAGAGGATIGSIIGGAAGGGAGFAGAHTALNWIAYLIAYLVIIIAILSALFRTWFMLIKAYVFLLLGVILSPFWIMSGLFPGFSGGFGPWIRSIIANLAAFPTVLVLFLLGQTIQNQVIHTNSRFTPPFLGNMGTDPATGIASIIGLGLILIMPEALNLTKSVLKAPDFKLTAAAARPIAFGGGFIGKPIGGLKNSVFGENRDGTPKIGTRAARQHFGALASVIAGGSLAEYDPETKTYTKGPLVRIPGMNRLRSAGRAVRNSAPAQAVGNAASRSTAPVGSFGQARPRNIITNAWKRRFGNNPNAGEAIPNVTEANIFNRAQQNVTQSGAEWDNLSPEMQQQELDRARGELENDGGDQTV